MSRSADILSHTHVLLDNFNTSALDFYKSVEAKVRERQVSEISYGRKDYREGGILSASREYLRVSKGRLTFDICAAPYGTGYFFSWWYTKQPPDWAALLGYGIVFGLPFLFFVFISAAGFIKGIFFFMLAVAAAWFAGKAGALGATPEDFQDAMAAAPIVGPAYRFFFKPTTYYSEDTRLMFQETVQRCVKEAIEEVKTAKGLRALSPEEILPTPGELLGSRSTASNQLN
jgi:hypothetical protein